MYRLTNTVRNYDWGTLDTIAGLLGTEPSGEPQAELWIGAHPSAPSMAQTPAGPSALSDLIAADPLAALGESVATRFDGSLPFLLKILSAARPLSLQAHPSRAQARAGYAAENSAGVPMDSPTRNYKDANHKPELVFALTQFEALNGFRRVAESAALLQQLRGRMSGDDLLGELIADLAHTDESTGLRHATQRLLTLDASEAAKAVVAVVDACAGSDDGSARTAIELNSHHPGDAGVILSLLLNRVSLAAGDAMFLPAGNLHSYLSGTAVELMATSDNVLRGGLTRKHIDVPELLSIVVFDAGLPELAQPHQTASGQSTLAPPIPDFQLTVLDLDGAAAARWDDGLPRTAIVLEGNLTLRAGDGSELALRQGESVFIAAADSPLTITGTGRLVAAEPGMEA